MSSCFHVIHEVRSGQRQADWKSCQASPNLVRSRLQFERPLSFPNPLPSRPEVKAEETSDLKQKKKKKITVEVLCCLVTEHFMSCSRRGGASGAVQPSVTASFYTPAAAEVYIRDVCRMTGDIGRSLDRSKLSVYLRRWTTSAAGSSLAAVRAPTGRPVLRNA